MSMTRTWTCQKMECLALFSEVLFEMCFMTSGRHRGRLESRRMSLLTNPAVLRFRTGLLGLPGTDGRDIRRARHEARKKRQSGSNKRAASIGGTFIHPLIFASPTKYGPTGGGLGGIVGDSNAPSCLASAHRQTPYLGRAVGGPGARCRNDFTSWLPPDGRCIRASDFMGASTSDVSHPVASYRTVETRTHMRAIGAVATEWRQRRRPELQHYGTSIQGQDQAYRAPNKAQPVATLRYSLATPPYGRQTCSLDAEEDATQGCDGMLAGKSSSCPFAFHKERRLWGSTIHHACSRLHAPFTASGNQHGSCKRDHCQSLLHEIISFPIAARYHAPFLIQA
ncbi:hypothetical protein BGZ61DRAFT_481764 [Ilyonectria robusta]|uniref:uncharacterized protein n=1 Tax=Ilyonectria robusta TaxID=1079257 RepID=UPI001E8CD655|nr:uncharacterized protein BGZ61DRAFT_481764 [Ilyonectria robusta]KAH8677162.1 hypothetical protein BGZ61DRAFT_481764 [Ilyonectria robusta]